MGLMVFVVMVIKMVVMMWMVKAYVVLACMLCLRSVYGQCIHDVADRHVGSSKQACQIYRAACCRELHSIRHRHEAHDWHAA